MFNLPQFYEKKLTSFDEDSMIKSRVQNIQFEEKDIEEKKLQ